MTAVVESADVYNYTKEHRSASCIWNRDFFNCLDHGYVAMKIWVNGEYVACEGSKRENRDRGLRKECVNCEHHRENVRSLRS